ncbi:MAG: dipeptide epimerase, partial [Rubrobacter sp.]|nr:dipeptide epimerase [Rubrobacter sp.]
EALRRVTETISPLPVIADESAVVARDVPALAGSASGVNVKLAKCGGIRGALRMIHTARAHGMLVMLGCMVETSLGIAAAAQVSGLVDFVDLDGALLLACDPFEGLGYEDGRILVPEKPGLGVKPR